MPSARLPGSSDIQTLNYTPLCGTQEERSHRLGPAGGAHGGSPGHGCCRHSQRATSMESCAHTECDRSHAAPPPRHLSPQAAIGSSRNLMQTGNLRPGGITLPNTTKQAGGTQLQAKSCRPRTPMPSPNTRHPGGSVHAFRALEPRPGGARGPWGGPDAVLEPPRHLPTEARGAQSSH